MQIVIVILDVVVVGFVHIMKIYVIKNQLEIIVILTLTVYHRIVFKDIAKNLFLSFKSFLILELTF